MAKDKREEEPKFRIIDRRGIEDDKPETPKREEKQPPANSPRGEESESPEMSKTEMTDEEKESLQKEAEDSFKYTSTIFLLLRMIAEHVWVHIGLIPNPVTRLTVKDLGEARKLIDLFGVILNHAEKDLDAATMTELRRIHSDLKINYTNQAVS